MKVDLLISDLENQNKLKPFNISRERDIYIER